MYIAQWQDSADIYVNVGVIYIDSGKNEINRYVTNVIKPQLNVSVSSAEAAAELSKQWAVKTNGKITEGNVAVDYSAKAWAIGGSGTETQSAKYWADKAQAVYDNMGDVGAILDYINGEVI